MIVIPKEKPLYIRCFEYKAPDLQTGKIEQFKNLWTVAKDEKNKIFIEWRITYCDGTGNVKRLVLKDDTTKEGAIEIVEKACSSIPKDTKVTFDKYYYLPDNLETAEDFAKVLKEVGFAKSMDVEEAPEEKLSIACKHIFNAKKPINASVMQMEPLDEKDSGKIYTCKKCSGKEWGNDQASVDNFITICDHCVMGKIKNWK